MFQRNSLWVFTLMLTLVSCSKEDEELVVNPYENYVKTIQMDGKYSEFYLYPYPKLNLEFHFSDSLEPNPIYVLDDLDTATSKEFSTLGPHNLKVFYSNGTLKQEFSFTIQNFTPNFYIADSFTPNGDGRNDSWTPITDSINGVRPFYSEYFEIRNYEHNIVYKSNSFLEPWTGRTGPTGIYYYYVKAVNWWGNKQEVRGKILKVD